jgi:hypothetical protein
MTAMAEGGWPDFQSNSWHIRFMPLRSIRHRSSTQRLTDYLSLSPVPSREIRGIAGGKRFLERFVQHFFQVPIFICVMSGTVDN